MHKLSFAARYSALAVVATALNLLAQWLCVQAYQGIGAIALSVAVGTGVGLIAKYLLDKHYIFAFTAQSAAHEGKTFARYTAMGLVTTALFWGTEGLFHCLWRDDGMRYLGGALGLAAGYWLKYQLDKRFVFVGGAA